VKIVDEVIREVQKAFRARKVATVVELAHLLHCSVPTARRRLKQWKTFTSYNNNGRYYVLPDVAEFDVLGLWRYRGIGFSRYGNLSDTVIGLINNSQSGLDGVELGKLLGLQARSFLSPFRDHSALRREKHQGRFVYFASEETIYCQQKQQRVTMLRRATLPSDSEAIAILVERIKHPQLSIEQLCSNLNRRSFHICPEAVESLFAYHGLEVKKTPPSK